MEMTMAMLASRAESHEETAICLVRGDGEFVAKAKVPTRPDAIANWLESRADALERVGQETGPLAVWLWNAWTERQRQSSAWMRATQVAC